MATESQELKTDRVPRGATQKEGTKAPAGAHVPLVVPALLSAGLLWLCYFPLNWGWLAWVALVPLLCLVRTPARARTVYLAAWIGGLVLFFAAIQWLRHADDRIFAEWGFITIKGGLFTWSALAIYCSLYLPLAVLLLRRLDRRTGWPLTFTLPLVWTALEFLRAHLMTGFPWYFLGHTQHEFLALIQVADLGGAYAVSFVVAAVNGLAFEWLYARPGFRAPFLLPERGACCPLRLQTLGVLGLLAAVLGYGAVRLSQEHFTDGPRVALVQGNYPQSLRNANTASAAERDRIADDTAQHFERLSDQAAALQPELIVWPETSFSESWFEVPSGHGWAPHELTEKRAQEFCERWKTAVLLGVNAYNLLDEHDANGARKHVPYNSAILLEPQAEAESARYDKIHRVPFGEYVPLREQFPFMNRFAPYDNFDYSIRPGESLTRFPLGTYRFGVLICFEDSDPFLSRHYVHDGPALLDFLPAFVSGGMYGRVPAPADGTPAVDFLVNISNDAWFLGSSEHDEHLAICRFRAIECRRSVARAVNMGISGVIDGSGRVVKLPGDTWEQSKQVAGVVSAAIPLDARRSIYAMVGDWLPALCWLMLLGGIVVGSKPGARKPQGEPASPEDTP